MGNGRRRRRTVAGAALALALALVIVVAGAGPAPAEAVTGAQLQSLAERAAGDPRALAQLRTVTQVDGQPIDVNTALAGASGDELASRLRTLAAGSGPAAAPAVAATEARHDAEAVLDGRRFKRPWVPRPFAGVLRTLGSWLRPLVRPFARPWGAVAGTLGGQLAVVAVVFAVALALSIRLIGRRSPRSLDRARPFGVDTDGLDADELERRAVDAGRAGDLALAVRLRFVAGVLRLDEAGVISYRSSLTTGQLRALLRSGSFPELASAFDEIAYGGRPADASDVEDAVAGWPRVLAEAQR